MTVNELRSILNTFCLDKEVGNYTVCISMEGVFTDIVTFDMNDKAKKICIAEK